jgi:hypothetical protein
MSTTLLVGFAAPTPVDEADVRSTVTVVENDAPPSVAAAGPDTNELIADPYTEGGLTTHQVASHVERSVKAVPDFGNANADPNSIVNRQVSTSGTAAAREAAGICGHGSMKIVDGIEDVITEGSILGSDYFTAHPLDANPTDNYMSPSQSTDPMSSAAAHATAVRNAQKAQEASMYNAWWVEMNGEVL